jgi:acyl-[acyl-carrier-protein] desaturase
LAPFGPTQPEILRELEAFVEGQLSYLLPVEKCWQPSDFLPNLGGPDWVDELKACREDAAKVPDSVLVTLVANMITEEALPSYHAWLANLEHGFDRTGVGMGGLAVWIRGWVGEEKRHGDALARYLYASGRVDMRAIETTIQHLLRNGFDPMTDNDVCKGFIYTSFQERATYIAHAGVARLAREAGDERLAKICDNIAGDEIRHERVYQRCVGRLFELTPDHCMTSLETMLRRTIIMPSRNMTDGVDADLFTHFSAVTQRNGIYTTGDYARIMEHLVKAWRIGDVPVTSDAGKRAQDYVARLPDRYTRLAARAEAQLGANKPRSFSWLVGRQVG